MAAEAATRPSVQPLANLAEQMVVTGSPKTQLAHQQHKVESRVGATDSKVILQVVMVVIRMALVALAE